MVRIPPCAADIIREGHRQGSAPIEKRRTKWSGLPVIVEHDQAIRARHPPDDLRTGTNVQLRDGTAILPRTFHICGEGPEDPVAGTHMEHQQSIREFLHAGLLKSSQTVLEHVLHLGIFQHLRVEKLGLKENLGGMDDSLSGFLPCPAAILGIKQTTKSIPGGFPVFVFVPIFDPGMQPIGNDQGPNPQLNQPVVGDHTAWQ